MLESCPAGSPVLTAPNYGRRDQGERRGRVMALGDASSTAAISFCVQDKVFKRQKKAALLA